MADKKIADLTEATTTTDTDIMVVQDNANTKKISIANLRTAITNAVNTILGNRTYTEQNVVTNGESLTASIDKLDQRSRLLVEYIVPSNTTSFEITGLDINEHKSYRIEIEFLNNTASNTWIYMFVNDDLNNANYYTQTFASLGTSESSGLANIAAFSFMRLSERSPASGLLQLTDGYASMNTTFIYRQGTGLEFRQHAYQKQVQEANITKLTFSTSVANAIKAGSKVRIYRGDM